ncbi:hypothetical protein GCM10020367_54830 [Streptomyces sannanensis]|uniref:Uncharacterized protein n=1 Tax=Streptomyces sannanensis TaxID=285536 RepID=A0ABP6SJ75_9ACTN
MGEFRRATLPAPVSGGGLMSGEQGGVRWIYAFTDEEASYGEQLKDGVDGLRIDPQCGELPPAPEAGRRTLVGALSRSPCRARVLPSRLTTRPGRCADVPAARDHRRGPS